MNMTSRLNQIPNHHTHARHCAGPVLSLLLFLLSPPVFAQTPAAPTGLTVTGASGSAISLSWTAPAGETIVRGYNVFRCMSPCTLDSSDRSSWRAWVTQGGGDPHPAPTQYTDACVTSGTTYVYAVEAEVNDDYVRSAWSNQVTATATGLSTQETTGQLVVDTGNALRVHEENPIGINLNYIRDHDDNRKDGAIPLEQAMREMGVRWLRYPGGEKSDWHFFASPPYEEADPVILDRTYNYRRELVVDEPYSQHAEGHTPLDFDTYMDYVKKSDGEPYVVVSFEPESRSGISAETYIRHAAAWVRYANETKGYEVEYWEIGNENWGSGVDTRDYATRGLEIAKAMKEVDPDIKIGMSGNSYDQFKTVLDIAGEYLDFLTLSNYRGDGWGENGFDHYRALPNGTLSKADDAVRAIATSDYADSIEVIITEFNAVDFQERWPWRNDLGHAIVVFDMLGEFLYDPHITSAMLWTTRWMNADDPYQMWYALNNENRPTAVGRALSIWGRFFKPNMVEVTVPMSGVNAYAAFDPDQETLTLFVINKSTAEQTVPVRIECGAVFAKCGSGFSNVDVYHFTGTGDSDMDPQFRKEAEPAEVIDNMLELRLLHTAITVVDFKFSGTEDDYHEAPAPTGLTVVAAGETGISLSWSAPAGETDVRGYNVYRCEEGNMPCAPEWIVWVTNGVGDPPPAPTEYTDTNVAPGTTYRYAVGASVGNDYRNSAWSNQVTAVAEPQTPHSGTGDTFIQKHHQVKKAIDDFEDAPGGTTWAEAMNADSEDTAPHVLSFRSRAAEAVLGGTFIDQYQYLEKGNLDYVSDPGGTTWTETAWQGERVHAPLVVWANDSAWQGTLDYEMSDLTGGQHQVIPRDRVRLLFPTYVTADPERRGCDGYATRDGVEPVYLADALSTTPAPVALPAEPFKVWLAIDVPEGTVPGSYSGLFVVRDPALEDAEVSFTVNVVVQNHRLPAPSEWQFELNLWQHPEWVLRHYNAAHPEARIKRWSAGHYDLLEGSYRLLGDAGQKWVTTTLKDGALGAPGMVSWTRVREDGNDWRFDFTAFGAHVETLMGWGIGPRIEAFGLLGWNRDEIPYWSEQRRQMGTLDAPVGSVAHRAAWQAFLPAFRAYLEGKGWFAQTWLSIDESDAALLGPLVDLVRADDPAWNIAISHFDTDLPADVLALAAATNIYLGIAAEAGLPNTADTIRTVYTSCADGSRVNAFITPDSNPAEVEWLTWYAGKLDRDGYSRWAYDYWRAAEPLDMRQLSFTSGDTALVYRTSNDSDLEAMISIRLTLLRYGIQQYEKRRILRELYARCEYPTGLALLDQLVNDSLIALESAGSGNAGADLVRAHEQLDIVSADAQAIADGCN